MNQLLRFADSNALADLATYAARARTVDPDGALRLEASGMTLAAYVAVLPGHGLMGEGSVLGLRVMRLAEPRELDVTVSLRSIADRLAGSDTDRLTGPGEESSLSIPPATVTADWAAINPPRGGWERVGSVGAADLQQVAVAGIAEVARGAPTGSGAQVVQALRRAVWQRETSTVPPVLAGAAFAAYVLGFLGAGDADVYANGRWSRLSTPTGHVLLR